MTLRLRGVLLAALCACAKASHAPGSPPSMTDVAPTAVGVATAASAEADGGMPSAAGRVKLTARSFPLPGANGPVTTDYLACERLPVRVWVPVGDTGSVDVFDVATGTFTSVEGFKTAEREAHGRKRLVGPSAATVGEGFVYVGNRATSEVCAVDETTLKLGRCVKLPTPTDGVAYVESAKEVWVTTPRDHSLTVLDASTPGTLKPRLVIKTDGEPEGYAVDSRGGLFYTNLEDQNSTIAIDIKTHAVKATWSAGCGADGPRGIAVDAARNLVMVACTDGVGVLDGHNGAPLGKLETGAGVDNIDYVDAASLLFVAAGKASRLTVARLSDKGDLSIIATGTTAEGARNSVTDWEANGVYVVDPHAARLLIFPLAMPLRGIAPRL